MDTFKHKIRPFLASLCMSLMIAAASTQPAYAVHDDDVFELDNGVEGSNAFDESLLEDPDDSNPDDWARIHTEANQCAFDTDNDPLTPDEVFNSCGYVTGPYVDPNNPGGDADISTFISDPVLGGVDRIYTGGGSKDDLDISQWQHTIGTPPDKDDLGPVGAAAYSSDDDPLRIYFHGGLYAENGDSSIGMWLFKKKIGLCTSGEFEGQFGVLDQIADDGSCTELGTHSFGDIFIVSENTNGGTQTNLTVFMWVGDALSDAEKILACQTAAPGFDCLLEPPKKTLARLTTLENATCTDDNPNDIACGNMNQVDTESPDTWGYTPKSAPDIGPPSPLGTDGIGPDDFPAITFFEGGVDLAAIFNELGCFSSFLMNTRTSASVRSQLKDVAVGDFELCKLVVTKTPSVPELCKDQGGSVDYTYVIENKGIATLNVTLWDDAATPEVGDDFDVISEATNGAQTSITLPRGKSNVTLDEPIPLVITVDYSDSDSDGDITNVATATGIGPFGTTVTAEATATVTVATCSILVEKSVDLDSVCDQNSDVEYTFKVKNTGTVELTNIVLKDDKLFPTGDATYTLASLPVGDSWYTFPVKAADLNLPEGEGYPYLHTNTVIATADAIAGVSVDSSDFAEVTLHKCDISITKNCTAEINAGQDMPFFGVITNEGTVPVVIKSLIDNNEENSAQAVSLSTYILAPKGQEGDSIDYNDVYYPLQQPGSHEDTITVTANAFDGAEDQETLLTASDTAGEGENECIITTQPSILVTKNCANDLAIGALTTFSGNVKNNGNVNLKEVTVTDTYVSAQDGTLTTVTVPIVAFDGNLEINEVISYSGSYQPLFTWNKNVVTASGTDVIYTTDQVQDWAEAICAACPFVDNPTSTGDSASDPGTFNTYVNPSESDEQPSI